MPELKHRAVALSVKKVLRSIEELPVQHRYVALKTLKSKIPSRHGSETHGRKLARKGKEKFAFSDRDRRRVALWYAEGLSYREIEVISHFIPANGMDAYRQINFILKKDETFCHKFIERAQANNRPLPEEAKAPRYCEA